MEIDIKKKLPGVKINTSLKNYTTFRIGGPAKYFYIARTKEGLIKAIKAARELNLPFFVFGGGSNLLIGDKGFNGLIIKNEARKFKVRGETIIAESGAILAKVVKASVDAGLSGIVEGGGIPGTIGGAVYGNAGWPKGKWAIGDVVKELEILLPDGKIKKVNKKWLAFRYRNSRIKTQKGKASVILEVILELKREKKIALNKRLQEILKIRFQKNPAGFSAGSVFKNPAPEQSSARGKSLRVSAGELIEKCGLKGKKIGKAQISEKHANFIINLGGARAEDIKKLINLAKRKVKNKFGIILKEEIRYFNF